MWNPNGDFGLSKLPHILVRIIRDWQTLKYGFSEWTYRQICGSTSMMNGMMDVERKRMILLSLNGPRTYRLLSILVEPSKPGNDGNVDRI